MKSLRLSDDVDEGSGSSNGFIASVELVGYWPAISDFPTGSQIEVRAANWSGFKPLLPAASLRALPMPVMDAGSSFLPESAPIRSAPLPVVAWPASFAIEL